MNTSEFWRTNEMTLKELLGGVGLAIAFKVATAAAEKEGLPIAAICRKVSESPDKFSSQQDYVDCIIERLLIEMSRNEVLAEKIGPWFSHLYWEQTIGAIVVLLRQKLHG